jgi:predicted lipoprotein with Yx(FWY)xxD motif
MGISLYLFEQDKRPGDHLGPSNSHCIGDCLILFRPMAANQLRQAAPEAPLD